MMETQSTAPEPLREAVTDALGTSAAKAGADITPVRAAAFMTNLRGGMRAALCMPVRDADFAPSFMQALLFALLSLLSMFAFDVARVGVNGQFAWYGMPMALMFVPVLLWAASLICAGAGQPGKTLTLLTGLSAAALFVHTGVDGVGVLTGVLAGVWGAAMPVAAMSAEGIGFWLLPAWISAVTLALAARLGCVPGLRALHGLRSAGATAAGLVLVAAAGAMNLFGGALWYPVQSEAANAAQERHGAAAHEDVIYAQPRLLARALGALTPGRVDAPNLYYVGMAGYASQDVFMKEVIAAEAIFKARFGAEGRTIKLINNSKTLAEVPAAGINALQATLDGVGRAMDKEKDILFLFLTSHGGRDHKFSLDMWPWRFGDLDPKRLRGLIDASGIKWKVVLVSACYSGGFVEALKSPTTLVITASAPDKNSFGCSNEAEFTYFGKAYFDQALRKTISFTAAFELARAEVIEREAKEKQTPSEPQIALGAEIAVKLQAFEAGLKSAAAGIAPGVAPAAASVAAAASGSASASASAASASASASAAAVAASASANQPLDPAYQQLAQAVWPLPVMRNDQRLCAENQVMFGPAEQIKGEADYFGGIRPGHALWPGVVAAYERYATKVCADRRAEEWWGEYAALLARHLTVADAQGAVKHFAAHGAGYLRAVAATDVEFGNERTRWSRQIAQSAGHELSAAMAAIYRERDARAAAAPARR